MIFCFSQLCDNSIYLSGILYLEVGYGQIGNFLSNQHIFPSPNLWIRESREIQKLKSKISIHRNLFSLIFTSLATSVHVWTGLGNNFSVKWSRGSLIVEFELTQDT